VAAGPRGLLAQLRAETVTDATELGWVRFRVVDPRPLLPPRPTAADLGLPEGYEHVYGGKVRDLFRTPTGDLLVVASDRISAYDWVLPTPIPDKGRILTQMSLWWFDHLSDLVANHIVSADDSRFGGWARGRVSQSGDAAGGVRRARLPDRLRTQ
jgi:hypothetical protein